MKNFNNSFYQTNKRFTRKDAEKVMLENGYSDFQFKAASFSNGSSFYFSSNGIEIRVSDHPLTGKRAFDTVQLSLVKISTLKMKNTETNGISDFMKGVYSAMLKKGAITIEEYNAKLNA